MKKIFYPLKKLLVPCMLVGSCQISFGQDLPYTGNNTNDFLKKAISSNSPVLSSGKSPKESATPMAATTKGAAVDVKQNAPITGRVVDETGIGMPGVTVVVKGTTIGAATNANGNYSLSAPANAMLVFSFIGYQRQEVQVNNRSTVDVTMATDATALQEVVVTGYTTEKKRDIIGSVAVVNTEELLSTPAANIQSQLQGRAAGVTVSGSGQPGAGAKVRIRGFTSFGNNDPLYVIDGVPTYDPSQINPQDIESTQILKDATAASIYGSRAANGVIIITTKQGKVGTTKINFDTYAGVQVIPESTFPEMLNAQQYGEYLFTAARNAGQAYGTVDANGKVRSHTIYGSGQNPVVPDYLISSNGFRGGVMENDPRVDPSRYNISDPNNFYQLIETSPGTNWFKEITRPAVIQSHQMTASGGFEKGNFVLGANYFNQEGTFYNTGYERFTVRANTQFKPYESIRIGENIQLSYFDRQGSDNVGEGGAWANAYRMVTFLPAYDINGGYAGNNVGESGNGYNPLAVLGREKDDKNYGYRIFGNVFGEVDLFKGLTARTSFGLDYGNNYQQDFTMTTYERSENINQNTYTERFGYGYSWTWTNTLAYSHTFADVHALKAIIGYESISDGGRRIIGTVGGLTFGDNVIDFRSLNTGTIAPLLSNEIALSRGLVSQFARLDYGFNDKYLFNATVRRDGSSVFGIDNRYGVFPAVGAAWRISGEPFMQGLTAITELKLRGGWGQMGSQRNVPGVNSYSFFSSSRAGSWYDLNGSNSSPLVGYRPSQEGISTTKWETTETTNIGIDASFWNGKLDLTVEGFNVKTRDLLAQRQRDPRSPNVTQPFINIGDMLNRGIDANVTTRGSFAGNFNYDATLTFTHYINRALKVGANADAFIAQGASRLGGVTRTQAGQPISSFYGYQLDGIYQTQAEVDAGPETSNKWVGSWRIKDINGPDGVPDGRITDADQTFIGSPIPDFQTGLNLSLGYKNFDVSSFLFWNYGNEVYNFTKWWTDLRGFVGGVSTRVLENSWSETNRNGNLPIIRSSDAYSGSISNDYYVESGSYLRLRNLQLGYTVPTAAASRLRLTNLRVYVQGQNLFTVTKYTGPDPDISIQGSETLMGVDQSGFPQARQFIVGLNFGF